MGNKIRKRGIEFLSSSIILRRRLDLFQPVRHAASLAPGACTATGTLKRIASFGQASARLAVLLPSQFACYLVMSSRVYLASRVIRIIQDRHTATRPKNPCFQIGRMLVSVEILVLIRPVLHAVTVIPLGPATGCYVRMG